MVNLLRTIALLLAICCVGDAQAQKGREARDSTRSGETRSAIIARSIEIMARSREQARVSKVVGESSEAEMTYVGIGDSDRANASSYLNSLSPEDFVTYLHGTHIHERRERLLKSKNDPLYEFYRGLRDADDKGKREIYFRILDELRLRHQTQWLDNQGPYVATQLHHFIEQTGWSGRINREAELLFVGRYFDTLTDQRYKVNARFPFAAGYDKLFDYQEAIRVEESTIQTKDRELRIRGIEAFIERSPTLHALNIKTWHFKDGGIEQLARIAERLDAPLPGGQPEIMYFFDPAVAVGATAEMSKAWTFPGRAEPKYLDHNDLSQLMDGMAGKTLILIGHIENQSFVMERGGAQPPLVLSIPDAIDAAIAKNVFFLPVGCESAKAGAYYGFQRPITTAEVANMLRAIPTGALKVGDVLRGFASIGDLIVDATQLDRFLELVMHRKERPYKSDVLPIAVIRIPASAGASNSLDEFMSVWMSTNRSWYDKGWMAQISAAIRDAFALVVLLGGALLLLFSTFLRTLQRQRAHLQRWSMFIRVSRILALVFGIALVVVALLSMSFLIGLLMSVFMLVWYWGLIREEIS